MRVEYKFKNKSGQTGCMMGLCLIFGLISFVIPVLGWIMGPFFIGLALIMGADPIKGGVFVDKIMFKDEFETLRKKIKFRLESGELLNMQCRVCNNIGTIYPKNYYK